MIFRESYTIDLRNDPQARAACNSFPYRDRELLQHVTVYSDRVSDTVVVMDTSQHSS